MNDPSPAHTRLHALIGDAVHDLPPRFIRKLEHILADQTCVETTTDRVVNLFRHRNRASATDDKNEAHRPISVFHQNRAASISRKLAGLSAIVQILDAAHHCREGESSEPVLGTDMVEGLLAAGRELFDAVDEGMGCPR